MRVGYSTENYASRRTIIGVVPDHEYVKVYNLYHAWEKLAQISPCVARTIASRRLELYNSFLGCGLHPVDVAHVFNGVSFGRTPWVTTFETIVPRSERTSTWHTRMASDGWDQADNPRLIAAVSALAGEPCKRLIAMSACNLAMELRFLREFPRYCGTIERKLEVLHPPQRVLLDSYGSKPVSRNGPIRFMFVGRDLFRKGGMAILQTFTELRRRYGDHIALTLVSSMKSDDHTKREDVEYVRRTLDRNDWIEFFSELPNQEVLSLMRNSHVGLLPTHADTYGYSVLEFQASGCPVISTDVRALPEINNEHVGWLIRVPKDHDGNAIRVTDEDRAALSSAIHGGLRRIVEDIMADPQAVGRKGVAALERVRAEHSPKTYAARLAEIYRQAVS